MPLEQAAIARLHAQGWNYFPRITRRGDTPARRSGPTTDAVSWAAAFSRLSNPDDTVWFLSLEDYARDTGSDAESFAWNAFEVMSLEAASGEREVAAIGDFWSRHLPILISVRGPYAYVALRDDGVVVYGEEPEFEETQTVAESLGALLRHIAEGSIPQAPVVDGLLFNV